MAMRHRDHFLIEIYHFYIDNNSPITLFPINLLAKKKKKQIPSQYFISSVTLQLHTYINERTSENKNISHPLVYNKRRCIIMLCALENL